MSAAKIKNFLINLYPELSRFKWFDQFGATIAPALTPRLKKIIRWGLPAGTVFLVLVLGLAVGSWLMELFFPRTIVLPSPAVVTPAVTSSYQSPFIPLKRSIETFNPQLPDPLLPVLDGAISLEPLGD